MTKVEPLAARELYKQCDPDQLNFETTADLEELVGAVGQPRAFESLKFGVNIQREGYNVFAMGYPGTGKFTLVHQFLEERAGNEEAPPDVCYVNNFDQSHRPVILLLPPGRGKELADDMEHVVEEAGNAVRAAFEHEEYQQRRQTVTQEFNERQQQGFQEIQQEAEERGLSLLRTPTGFAFAPVKEGQVIEPEDFKKLPEEERKKVEKDADELQQKTQKIFQKVPKWEREMRERLRDLDREITGYAVGPLIDEVRQKYTDIEKVKVFLDAVEKDIIDNAQTFTGQENQQQQLLSQIRQQSGLPDQSSGSESPELRRYKVNVVVDNSESEGAPIVHEDNPTYQNLVGRVEHMAQMGALLTDFNMIRSGALHRANGGYLLIDGLKLLMQPFAWEGLKRVLRSREIKMESLAQMYSLFSTVSLEPEPLPLNVKVALFGPPMLYYILRYRDPEFAKLFKVIADFDLEMERTDENLDTYSRLITGIVRQEGLKPFDRGAVARVIEQSARTLEDKEKVSVHLQGVKDLLSEADYWAGQNGNGTVTAVDVQKAVDSWIYRSDRLRERTQEQIERNSIFIDTQGSKTGQVNGLSVIILGDFSYGRPNRITARIRMGKGEVVDIEREVQMGGPIHSKGVMILTGFLGERYALNRPLSLSASLVFEQSYSGIEGDSASSAELYALLSAIAEVPVRQSLAVTGSVNQHGQVQPIGGVNEKIEGFFDTCKTRGLTGEQGVLVPASNVKNLMLRQDVIEAVEQGKFHVYPVKTIDEGIELLTGMEAGEPDQEGNYPEKSINGLVHRRLEDFAEKQKKFSASAQRGDNEKEG